MKLYHIPRWRSTRPVWMYKELSALYPSLPPLVVHEFDPSTFRTEKPDWYLKINPNGKVPTMEHNNIAMWDGTAICCYMLQNLDTEQKLFKSSDPTFLALFYQWSFFCSGTLDNLTATSSPIQRALVESIEEPKNLESNRRAWLDIAAPSLVQTLGDKKYIYGDQFTALDVIIGYNISVLSDKVGWLTPETFPSLSAYYARIKSRPGFQEATTSEKYPPSWGPKVL